MSNWFVVFAFSIKNKSGSRTSLLISAAAAAGWGKWGKYSVKELEIPSNVSVISHREMIDPEHMRLFKLCAKGLLKEIWSHQNRDFNESLSLGAGWAETRWKQDLNGSMLASRWLRKTLKAQVSTSIRVDAPSATRTWVASSLPILQLHIWATPQSPANFHVSK